MRGERAVGKTAVIAGASGLVGSRLLDRLLAETRYARITAVVRRPLDKSHPKLEVRTVDFERLEDGLEGLSADDWFCALGTTIRQAGTREAFHRVDYGYPLSLGRLARNAGARQYLVVTAMGASARSSIFYNRVKGELERDLAALNLPRLLLFRPSLLLGDRETPRLGERAGALVMKALNPLMRGPLRTYRAIRADDVAAGMIAAARMEGEPGVRIFDSGNILRLARTQAK